ncbi:piggyBac transposable element-derived protein 4-like [Epinephelus fuscoguttatus]|uniref:piggyBac transposable element-derived protein 4-like n=1 Tax=Epinephelus fuscoguttatus TaxID=293821 RepID=UPI0020D12EAF|nr:piggyBac transposable element-derived protein 4-like [Epinephelus fuscoguttatus]
MWSSQPHHSPEAWRTESEPYSAPGVSRFMPHRPPGAQVDMHPPYTLKELFQLFFSTATVKTLCKNTNKYAAIQQEMGKKYSWADVEVEELYKFFGLLMYMALVSLPSLQDYWKQNHILSVPFPAMVMTRDRFRSLRWNIHPSNPEENVINDRKKGTPDFDKLFRTKPLMDEIRTACQAHYHPRKELAVDERMVATKAKTGLTST